MHQHRSVRCMVEDTLGARIVRGEAVETGHVAEVVVPGQLRQPDVVDLQRAAEGVDDR